MSSRPEGIREPIFLYGAGGHGRSVREVVLREGRYEVAVVLDDAPAAAKRIGDLAPEGGRELLAGLPARGIRRGVVAIGDNRDRELVVELVEAAGLGFVTVVDPSANLAHDVEMGDGTVVMPGAIVNVGSAVGAHAILNTACSVDHDCRLDDFSHLSPGVRVSGECSIGARTHVGIGACVIQTVKVGAGAMVGAGAAVVEDVPDDTVVVGVPARPIGRGL